MTEKILIFIPCYNCAPQIGRTLAGLLQIETGTIAQVLVVDNQSSDGTIEAAQAAATSLPDLDVIIARNRNNYNLGGSHKAAFAYASRENFSHVVVLHGDDQGNIADLLPVLRSGQHRLYDACLGARFMPGSVLKNYSRFRIFGNHVFNHLFSIITGRRIYDLGSGLNIFARSLFTDPFLDRYADDLRFNVYLLLGLFETKKRTMFFPISWREDDQISNVKLVSQTRKTLEIAGEYLFRRNFFTNGEHRAVVRDGYEFDLMPIKN